MNLPASQIKPKDIIVLDCGVGGEPFCDRNCKILDIYNSECLFTKEKRIYFYVETQDCYKEKFNTCNFKPTDLIEVAEIYKPKKNKNGNK